MFVTRMCVPWDCMRAGSEEPSPSSAYRAGLAAWATNAIPTSREKIQVQCLRIWYHECWWLSQINGGYATCAHCGSLCHSCNNADVSSAVSVLMFRCCERRQHDLKRHTSSLASHGNLWNGRTVVLWHEAPCAPALAGAAVVLRLQGSDCNSIRPAAQRKKHAAGPHPRAQVGAGPYLLLMLLSALNPHRHPLLHTIPHSSLTCQAQEQCTGHTPNPALCQALRSGCSTLAESVRQRSWPG